MYNGSNDCLVDVVRDECAGGRGGHLPLIVALG